MKIDGILASLHLDARARAEQRLREETEEAKGRLESALYRRDIDLSIREWSAGNLAKAREVLRGCPEALRAWDWHCLQRLAMRPRLLLHGFNNFEPFEGVAFSPDGRLLAAGGGDGIVRVWETARGLPKHILSGHEKWARGIVFSPDGHLIASAGDDSVVKLWDLATSRVLRTFRGPNGWLGNVVFSPDSRVIAVSAEDGAVWIWDINSNTPPRKLEGHIDKVRRVAFSKDGRLLVSGSWDSTVKIWDVDSGQCRSTLRGHSKLGVMGCAFFPNNRDLLEVGGDGWIKVWNVETGQEIGGARGHQGIMCLALAPDGSRYATGGDDGTVKVWDAETHSERLSLKLHNKYVMGLAFDGTGLKLASAGIDGWVQILNLAPWKDEEESAFWYGRADELLESGQLEQALGALSRATNLDPNDWQAWAVRGDILAMMERYPEAFQALKRATGLNPWAPYLWHKQALTALGMRSSDAYRGTCAEALGSQGATAHREAGNYIAWVCALAEGGMTNSAALAKLAERAVSDDPNNVSYKWRLAQALYRASQPEKAAQLLKGMEKNCGRLAPNVTFLLAMARKRSGQEADSIRLLKEAIRLAESDSYPDRWWDTRLALRLLREEAEAMIVPNAKDTKK